MRTKRLRADGARTYDSILRAAADLASTDGLDGLTIGSLAERLKLSKSGLFTHFGSKERLQLATIEAARLRYVATVLEPALKAPRGVARLRAVCERVLDYIEKPEFPGGCFFCVTTAEFHAKPGTVRDAINLCKGYKRGLLLTLAEQARELGELSADVDTAQLAFELETVVDTPTWSVATEHKQRELDHARKAVENILGRAGAPAAPCKAKSRAARMPSQQSAR